MKTTRIIGLDGGIRLRLLLILGAIAACLALAWMLLLPAAVARYARSRTGFGIEIRSLYVNPFTATVRLKGLVVTNPPEFPRRDFVEVREFRANAQLFSLFSRRVVVDDAALDVAAVTLVRNEHGRLNATDLRDALARAPAPAPARDAAAQAGPAQPGRPPRQFLIKHLTLTCDRVVIADYSKRRPAVSDINLRFHHVYTDVTSAQQLIAPLPQVLSPVAVALGYLTPETDSLLRSAGQMLQDTGRRTGDAVKALIESLEKGRKN